MAWPTGILHKDQKGGTGSYHIEYDYGNYPGYKYTRKMIQIMNPAPKPK